MKVYNIEHPHVSLPEFQTRSTGEVEMIMRHHNCKTVKYEINEYGPSAIDRFLIDIHDKENAKELYLHEMAEMPVVYSPTSFLPIKSILVSYYAHDKLTKEQNYVL